MSLEVLERPSVQKTKPETKQVNAPLEISPSRDKFTVPADHPFYEDVENQPRFVGKGAEQIVYEVPKHPDIVVKVNYQILAKMLRGYLAADNPVKKKKLASKLKGDVLAEQSAYQRLQAHFEREHLLTERVTRMKLPITQDLLQDTFGKEAPLLDSQFLNMPFVVRLQEKLPERVLRTGVDLRSDYAEQSIAEDSISQGSYASGSMRWLSDHSDNVPFDAELFLQCQRSTALADLIMQANDYPLLKEAIQDFVTRAVEYTQVTGQILDVAGENNIIFFQDDKSDIWRYLLVDASFPNRVVGQIEIATEALENYRLYGETLEKDEVFALYNALNYTRTINGLADAMGMQDRVSLLHSRDVSIDPTTIDWDDLRRYLLRKIEELR